MAASIAIGLPQWLASCGSWFSLGDEPPSDDDTRKEALLRAQLAFGMPPRDEAEWEVAERLLDPETLREVHRQVDEADRRIASMRSEVGDRHDRG